MNLNKILKILGFGFLVWLIPTLVTLSVSYINIMSYYDVISSVAIAVTVIVFAHLYFMDLNKNYVQAGIITGIVWLVISIVLDIVLIFLGINKVTLMEYMIYMASIYIIIPAESPLDWDFIRIR